VTTKVGELSVDVSANLAKLYEGLNQAVLAVNRSAEEMKGGFDKISASIAGVSSAFSGLGGIIGTLGATLGVGAFASLVTSAIEGEAELYRLSQRPGATVEALSAMRAAAVLTHTGMDEVAIATQRFAKNISDAQGGTGKTAQALKQLGFNAQTFASSFKSTDEAMLAYAQAMAKYGDSTGKTANAMTTLGRNGAALIPFLEQIARSGLSAVKVTTEQARAAEELEKSWLKLGAAFKAIVITLANNLVPVLQAIIEHIKLFAEIGAAAIGYYVVWPAVISAVTAVLNVYKEAVIGAVLAEELLGQERTVAGILGIGKSIESVKTQIFSFAGLLKTLPAVLFAGFAGWNFGKFIADQFVEARILGIIFVESMLVAWENIKAGAAVAWEYIKFQFNDAIEGMKVGFGKFVELVGQGLAHVPGLSEFSGDMIAFGQSLQTVAGGAAIRFNAAVANITYGLDKEKDAIRANTKDMIAYELHLEAVRQKAQGAKTPELPKFPGLDTSKLKDSTAAIDAYIKAYAALLKAQSDAAGKIEGEAIKTQQADLERSYQRNLVDFNTYLTQRTELQKAAQANAEAAAQRDVDIQQQLVDKLSDQLAKLQAQQGKYASENKSAEFTDRVAQASVALFGAQKDLINSQTALTLVQQKGADIGKDYFEVLQKQYPELIGNNKALQDQVKAQQLANETYGLTADQIQLVIAAKIQEKIATDIATGADQKSIDALREQIAIREQLANTLRAGEDIKRYQQGWTDLIKSVTDGFSNFFQDLVEHGSVAFKNLWNNFKAWALEAIAKIAAQQIVLSIVGSLAPGAAFAQNALAGAGGPLGSILSGGGGLLNLLGGGGGGGGGLSSIIGSIFGSGAGGGLPLANLFATSGVGQALGLSEVALGGFADGVAGAGAGLTALGSAFTAAVPVIGAIAVAGFALYKFLKSKEGGPKEGGFAVAGVERGSYFPGESTAAGDAAVGKLVTSIQTSFEDALKKLGGKAFDVGFALGYDTDPKGKALSNVHGGVFAGGKSVFENPNPNVGRSPEELQAELQHQAQQMLLAALQSSDLPKYVAALLNSVSVASASGDEITQILQTAEAIKSVADQFPALQAQIENLKPEDIKAFIDALGGADQLTQSFAYLQKNFETTADATKKNADDLAAAFDGLGLTVPATHKAFMDLLSSFDLTTDSGRQLYASVIALAPAFVAVAGSADDAAKQLQDATDFFKQNFYSSAEQNASKVAAATAQLNAAQQQLGIIIPRSIEGFRALVESIDQTTPAGQAMYAALIKLAPTLIAVTGSLADASSALDAVGKAAKTIQPPQDWLSDLDKLTKPFEDQIKTLAEASPGNYGEKLGIQIKLNSDKAAQYIKLAADAINSGNAYMGEVYTQAAKMLTDYNVGFAQHIARFNELSAQYGDATAEQLLNLYDWYDEQKKIFYGNAAALDTLNVIYKQKFDAIVAGTADAVQGTADNLDKLRKAIQDYLDSLKTSDLSPLSPAQKLAAAQGQYQDALAKAAAGDPTALQDITKFADQYLKQARDFYASSPLYSQIFADITSQLEALATGDKTKVPKPPVVTNTAVTQQVTDTFDALTTGAANLAKTVPALTTGLEKTLTVKPPTITQPEPVTITPTVTPAPSAPIVVTPTFSLLPADPILVKPVFTLTPLDPILITDPPISVPPIAPLKVPVAVAPLEPIVVKQPVTVTPLDQIQLEQSVVVAPLDQIVLKQPVAVPPLAPVTLNQPVTVPPLAPVEVKPPIAVAPIDPIKLPIAVVPLIPIPVKPPFTVAPIDPIVVKPPIAVSPIPPITPPITVTPPAPIEVKPPVVLTPPDPIRFTPPIIFLPPPPVTVTPPITVAPPPPVTLPPPPITFPPTVPPYKYHPAITFEEPEPLLVKPKLTLEQPVLPTITPVLTSIEQPVLPPIVPAFPAPTETKPLGPGLPTAPGKLDLTSALFNSLPVVGTRLLSNEDLRKEMLQLKATIVDVMSAHADAQDENGKLIVRAITNSSLQTVDGLRGNLK